MALLQNLVQATITVYLISLNVGGKGVEGLVVAFCPL